MEIAIIYLAVAFGGWVVERQVRELSTRLEELSTRLSELEERLSSRDG